MAQALRREKAPLQQRGVDVERVRPRGESEELVVRRAGRQRADRPAARARGHIRRQRPPARRARYGRRASGGQRPRACSVWEWPETRGGDGPEERHE